jgi:hypothetical protein
MELAHEENIKILERRETNSRGLPTLSCAWRLSCFVTMFDFPYCLSHKHKQNQPSLKK